MNIEANNLIDKLIDNGHEVFIVGGAVRDMLSGDEAKDIDLVTDARPEQITKIFKKGHKVSNVGKSFGVVIVDGVEIATYRHDNHVGIGDKNCTVTYADTIEEDLSRRDLTINAIAVCAQNGNIVDDHNGHHDLLNGLVRFVGNADARILEDPNRIVRACRFLAKIDGEFEIETYRALRRNAKLIKTHVAPERIRLEILKAMSTKRPSLFFAALESIGALQYILPELSKAWNHSHGNHHVETVFDHMMMAGDHAKSNDPILRLAIFLHDYGKPYAYVLNLGNESANFVGHEVFGEKSARRDLKRLKFSNEEIDRIGNLIRSHMYGVDFSDKSFRRLMKKFNERNVDWRDFLRCRMCDRAANIKRDPFMFHKWREWTSWFKKGYKNEPAFSAHDLKLSGADIISVFNLHAGPIIGQIQKYLLNRLVDEGFENNDRDILISWVKDHNREANNEVFNDQ